MSASGGVTHYHEEMKDLLRLLQHLPDTIPIGDDHNFIGYAPNGKDVDEKGCIKTVISHDIGRSFGSRRTPAGEDIIITFKSRGPGLEEVVNVLRDFITGSGGPNWAFDDLIDDPPPAPPTTAAPQRGRPKTGILDQLTIACHTKSTNTPAGEGCHESWSAPRMSGRTLPHASACQFLPEEIRKLALLENAKASLTSTDVPMDRPPAIFDSDKHSNASAFTSFARHITSPLPLFLSLYIHNCALPLGQKSLAYPRVFTSTPLHLALGRFEGTEGFDTWREAADSGVTKDGERSWEFDVFWSNSLSRLSPGGRSRNPKYQTVNTRM
ncbi:hypothetical protein B0H14DRAFT_3701639 [Mycena olivaceomarginata]|nr:hypothetical protein B0H14DRAFT_3701639 [Mycena olivaceomarginata]